MNHNEINYGVCYRLGHQILSGDTRDTYVEFKCPICGSPIESTLNSLATLKSKLCNNCKRKYKLDGGAKAAFLPYNTEAFWGI